MAIILSSVTAAGESSPYIQPSFPACEKIKLARPDLDDAQRLGFLLARRSDLTTYQMLPEREILNGITDPEAVKRSVELLQLSANHLIRTIEGNLDFYRNLRQCFSAQRANLSTLNCESLKREFNADLQRSSALLRRALALSVVLNQPLDLTDDSPQAINTTLAPIFGLPNPAGGSDLTLTELQVAEADLKDDLKQARTHVRDQRATIERQAAPDNYVSPATDSQLQAQARWAQVLVHQGVYATHLLEKPHLYFLQPRVSGSSSWSNSQIVEALDQLIHTAENEIPLIEAARDQGRLEFRRLNGESLYRSTITGEYELIQFITYPSTNSVLTDSPHLCGVAESLLQRFEVRSLQNAAVSLAAFGVSGGGGITFGLLSRVAQLTKVTSIINLVSQSSRVAVAVSAVGMGYESYRNAQGTHRQALGTKQKVSH